MKTNEMTKAPCLLTRAAVEYWEAQARAGIRRLWPMRAGEYARQSLRGWLHTLRSTQRVRVYRGWV